MGRSGLRRVLLVVASGLLLSLGVVAPAPHADAMGIRYLDEVFEIGRAHV